MTTPWRRAVRSIRKVDTARDDRGNAMSATYSVGKQGRRYPYYVSQALLRNEKERAGSIARVPAEEIERLVGNALGVSKGEASTGRLVTAGRPALSQS